VYLGVRLGQRGVRAQLSQGVFAQLLGIYQRTERTLGLEDDAVDDREIARWTAQAERLGRALAASSLHARHARASELAWLLRHSVTATIEEPRESAAGRRRWGRGEIEALVDGVIHNGRSYLRLEQPGGEANGSYRPSPGSLTRLPFV